ncbi:MAG: cob(I)yrinic acid a,c-diamide adenosyltransferase [Candidatus Peregrinibacteria bacterium]
MKISTKTGDKGETGLIGGKRVSKGSGVVEVLGSLDELVAVLGVCKVAGDEELRVVLCRVQRDLGGMMTSVAGGAEFSGDLEYLESEIESREDGADCDFVVPGRDELDARLHLARAICRRCERNAVREKMGEDVLKYLNRLSDLLFVVG